MAICAMEINKVGKMDKECRGGSGGCSSKKNDEGRSHQ